MATRIQKSWQYRLFFFSAETLKWHISNIKKIQVQVWQWHRFLRVFQLFFYLSIDDEVPQGTMSHFLLIQINSCELSNIIQSLINEIWTCIWAEVNEKFIHSECLTHFGGKNVLRQIILHALVVCLALFTFHGIMYKKCDCKWLRRGRSKICQMHINVIVINHPS